MPIKTPCPKVAGSDHDSDSDEWPLNGYRAPSSALPRPSQGIVHRLEQGLAQAKTENERLSSENQSLTDQLAQQDLEIPKLKSSINDLLHRVMKDIASPDKQQFRDEDIELLSPFITAAKLEKCTNPPETFSLTERNKHAELAGLFHEVEWDWPTHSVGSFAQMMLSTTFTCKKYSTEEPRAKAIWADDGYIEPITSDEASPLRTVRASALMTFLNQQLNVPEPEGLSFAWAAGVQVRMMCVYRLPIYKSFVVWSRSISECSILETVGRLRLDLATRHFLRERGQTYRDMPISRPSHPLFPRSSSECFILSTPLLIKALCGGKSQDSEQGWITIKENYVGVSEKGKLYSWLRDGRTDEWTLTTSLPKVGPYDRDSRTGEISWQLEDRVHIERYDFAMGPAGHFRMMLAEYIWRDLHKAVTDTQSTNNKTR